MPASLIISAILFAATLTFPIAASAETIVSGSLATQTWTKANSPYRIVDTTRVELRTVLTIEPGVDVLFDADVPVIVYGCVRAIGTATDSIRFLAGEAAYWKGLRVSGSDTSRFRFVRFSDGNANGTPKQGGALYVTGTHARVEIERSVFSGNQTERWGGAISAEGRASVSIRSTRFAWNTSVKTDGASVHLWQHARVTLDSVTMVHNFADDDAAGIYIGGNGSATLTDCIIDSNTVGDDGPGVYAEESATVQLIRTRVSNNVAANEGGAITILTNARLTMVDCVVEGNRAPDAGGAIFIRSTVPATIEGSTIADNTCTGEGGAIAVRRGTSLTIRRTRIAGNTASLAGGGIFASDSSTVTLGDVELTANTGSAGGAGYAGGGARIAIDSSHASGNTATKYGGGFAVEDSATALLRRVVVVSNGAPRGTELAVTDRASLELVNVTVAGTASAGVEGDVWIAPALPGWTAFRAVNTIFYNWRSATIAKPAGVDTAGIMRISYSVVAGDPAITGIGNLTVDPLFAGTAAGDFRLRAGSPAIDAGDPDSPRDPDGSRADMGALPVADSGPLAVVQSVLPPRFALLPNIPNPFNPSTAIRFSLAQPGEAHLAIYDVTGRLVRTLLDDTRTAGMHEVVWDGSDDTGRQVASGVFLYRLTAGEGVRVRRMVLVR